MIDFTKIKEIDIDYSYKRYDEESSYSETVGSRVLSSNLDTMRITIMDDDKTNDNGSYQLIITKKDNKLFIKGDFFETPDEWYETSVTITNMHATLISEDSLEKMEIILNF